jgi:hypothetical protein
VCNLPLPAFDLPYVVEAGIPALGSMAFLFLPTRLIREGKTKKSPLGWSQWEEKEWEKDY